MTLTVVATTLASFAMDQNASWSAWLEGAEGLIADESAEGNDVVHFAALQVDARGLEPFAPLLELLAGLAGSHWTYSLDDGRTSVTTANRLRHLTTGQNLCSDYATSVGADHMLFLAADCAVPTNSIARLREVDWPIVGGHVPTYCLDGPTAYRRDPYNYHREQNERWAQWDVRAHMPTAAFVLLERDFFKRVKWRWDPDLQLSDDPAMHYDAEHLFGFDPPAVVRHDVIGTHYPESIGAIETRGHDMKVQR